MHETSLSSILSALTCPKKILCPPILVLLLCFSILSAIKDAAIGPCTKIFFGFLSLILFLSVSSIPQFLHVNCKFSYPPQKWKIKFLRHVSSFDKIDKMQRLYQLLSTKYFLII